MEPIVMTGASGFLGSALLLSFLRDPQIQRVILISRREIDPSDRYLKGLFQDDEEAEKLWAKVETEKADLSEPKSLQQALERISSRLSKKVRLFHLAARISEKSDAAEINRLNVEATENLVDWANKYAERFVFVSSVVVFGSSRDPAVRSEKDFDRFDSVSGHSIYFASKRAAHLKVLERCKIAYDIFCPSVIHGPWDSLKDTRSRLRPFIEGTLSWVPAGGANFVSLSRVVRRLRSSLDLSARDQSRVELVVGSNWSFKEYIETYLRFCGIERTLKVLPKFPFRIMECLAGLLPTNRRSLVHGARYLYFQSEWDRRSQAEIQAETLVAVQESAKYLKMKTI